MDTDIRSMEWLAGAVIIVVYAYKRYNTPVTNRSSTTFARFSVFFLLYVLTILLLYWLAGSLMETSPELLKRLSAVAPGILPPQSDKYSQLTGPIFAALLLTTLMPNVLWLSTIDKRLLRFFWDLGQIPSYIIKQREWLRRAAFNIAPTLHNEIIDWATAQDIEKNDIRFEQEDSLNYEWARLCTLFIRVSQWQDLQQGKYARFLQHHDTQFETLKTEFVAFSTRAGNYFKRARKLQAVEAHTEQQEILEDLHWHLTIEANRLLKKICELIASGIFYAELTEAGRVRMIAKLGFDEYSVSNENLTPSQILTLAGSTTLAFLMISVIQEIVKYQAHAKFTGILFLAILMTISYGVSAYAAIFPKTIWRCTNIDQTKSRPIFGYFLSALIAAGLSLIAMISVRYTNNAFFMLSPEDNFNKVMTDLSWSYPYLIQSSVIGFVLAYIADNEHSRIKRRLRHMRRIDMLVMGGGLAFASLLTYCVIEGVGPFAGTRDPAFRRPADIISAMYFALQGALVGVVIGYLVPNWYRSNRARTPGQCINRLLHRSAEDIELEAGRLRAGELKHALMSAGALLAMADGSADIIEKDSLRQFLHKIAAYNLIDFSVSEGVVLFDRYVREFSQEPAETRLQKLTALNVLMPHPHLIELVMQFSLAIGYADGVFKEDEEKVFILIAEKFHLPPENYQVDFSEHNTSRQVFAGV